MNVPGAARLYVLRLDLLDPVTGGNKHFKLKYNLSEIVRGKHKKVVTFGGAWSNHLAATASGLRNEMLSGSLEVIAIVRGEEPGVFSETLKFCRDCGMKFHFVTREEYRLRNDQLYRDDLKKKLGDFYLLPEGGSNELAVKGCSEIPALINIDFDFICCPVGSGGTLAGITCGLKSHQKALGFVALKGAEYLDNEIRNLISAVDKSKQEQFSLIHDYHFGGFAKTTSELLDFKKQFEKENGFTLDYVYTVKMFYGIFDLLRKKTFPDNSTIIAVHTGGIQGNAGFES